MGKKKRIKALRRIANELPVVLADTCEKHLMTGEQLMKELDVHEIDGVKVEPGKEYWYRYPVQLQVNHTRALKRAFKEYGAEGIVAYAEAVHNKVNT